MTRVSPSTEAQPTHKHSSLRVQSTTRAILLLTPKSPPRRKTRSPLLLINSNIFSTRNYWLTEVQTLAEDYPSRLASQHALARAYRANGKVQEAVSLLEQVVKIKEQTLAEDHPDRRASQQVFATIFWELERRIAALQIMKHVVKIQRRVLDDHHPDLINSEVWLEQFEKETVIITTR